MYEPYEQELATMRREIFILKESKNEMSGNVKNTVPLTILKL